MKNQKLQKQKTIIPQLLSLTFFYIKVRFAVLALR